MTYVEYELDSESLQLLNRDCLRLDDSKLSPVKNMSCFGNDLKKLIIFEKHPRWWVFKEIWEDCGNHEGICA